MPRVQKRHVLSGIKVKEAMRRQVIKLPQSAPIDYCINRMIKYKINSLLLIDGKQRPVGIVSKTDIMSAFYAGFPTHLPVEDIMVGPPLYCYPDDELESSLDVMHHNSVHRLYVLGADASEVLGVLAYPDIVGLLYRYCRACDKGLLKTRHRKEDDAYRRFKVKMESLRSVIIILFGYLERTSCIGCGIGFQPRSFNFAAGSRSYREFFYGNLDFPDKRLILFFNRQNSLIRHSSFFIRHSFMTFFIRHS